MANKQFIVPSLPVNRYVRRGELTGSGGTWGSITGTLSDQTDLQTVLNGKAPSLGVDDNYVTDAQLTVINNTSGTNTGDQDLSTYIPYTGASQNIDFGANVIYGGIEGGAADYRGVDATTNDTYGGSIQFTAGQGLGTGNGGYFLLSGGVGGVSGNGGDVVLTPGTGVVDGNIKLQKPGISVSAILDTSLLNTSDKTFSLPNTSGTVALQGWVESQGYSTGGISETLAIAYAIAL